MIDFIVYIALFASGAWVGSKACHLKYDSLPWRTMKWNPGCMGYRYAQNGATIAKGEKAYLCLRISTDHLEPGEGLMVYHEED